MNEFKKQLELLEQEIANHNLELPDINVGREDVFDMIIKDKDLFATLLAYVSILTNGRYITIRFDLAKKSIEAKRNRKFHPLNVTLDILKYLDFIEYRKVEEEEIVIFITNDTLANDLNRLRFELEAQQDKIIDNADKIKSELNKMKDDLEAKKEEYDNTTASK